MALDRITAKHLRIGATLAQVQCERMTSLEKHLTSRYDVAEATRIVDHAEGINEDGTYTELLALLKAIGEKIGVEEVDEMNAAEQVEIMDEEDILERANELMEI